MADRPNQDSSRGPDRIIPRGLRSFDERDADAFLELLPGPCDRDGLPPTIRFRKTRIEEMDADETFPVGVMYGPSGCGKSSLVKAGLLPRLADHIVRVYVETTPHNTEMRLLKRLKKLVPSVTDDWTLSEILRVVRESGLGGGRKLLLVLDQFEQWLHVHGNEPSSQLLHALRQCDGANVQCLVLVREEYAVACLRFLDQLDMEMREGENFGVVDLFDQRHAEKVLRLFGQAFAALPKAGGGAVRELRKMIVHTLPPHGGPQVDSTAHRRDSAPHVAAIGSDEWGSQQCAPTLPWVVAERLLLPQFGEVRPSLGISRVRFHSSL